MVDVSSILFRAIQLLFLYVFYFWLSGSQTIHTCILMSISPVCRGFKNKVLGESWCGDEQLYIFKKKNYSEIRYTTLLWNIFLYHHHSKKTFKIPHNNKNVKIDWVFFFQNGIGPLIPILRYLAGWGKFLQPQLENAENDSSKIYLKDISCIRFINSHQPTYFCFQNQNLAGRGNARTQYTYIRFVSAVG